jgi:hypothetical protein
LDGAEIQFVPVLDRHAVENCGRENVDPLRDLSSVPTRDLDAQKLLHLAVGRDAKGKSFSETQGAPI